MYRTPILAQGRVRGDVSALRDPSEVVLTATVAMPGKIEVVAPQPNSPFKQPHDLCPRQRIEMQIKADDRR